MCYASWTKVAIETLSSYYYASSSPYISTNDPHSYFMHLQQTIIFWNGSVIHHKTSSSTESTNGYGCMKCPHSLPLSVFRTQCFSTALQPNTGTGRLVFHASISYTDTHTHTHTRQDSSQRMISSSQRPMPTQQAINTTYEHLCPQRDSNPRSQQSRGCRPTPQTRTFMGIETVDTAVFS
jgi:hypothetical protein